MKGQLFFFLTVTAAFAMSIFVDSSQEVHAFALPCHQITSYYGEPIPAGFGKPFDPAKPSRIDTVRAACKKDSVTIQVGTGQQTEYIYEQGYLWESGNWTQVTFQGSQKTGPWVIGLGEVTIPKTPATLASSDNYVVAYSCTWTGTEWRCGCADVACTQGFWQLQNFKRPENLPIPDIDFDEMTDVLVTSAVPQRGSPGQNVVIVGQGFTQLNNTVSFINTEDQNDIHEINGIPTVNGTRIDVVAPSTLTSGKYGIHVNNANGETEYGAFFLVSDPGGFPATLTSISPTSGGIGTQVTITGSGFTATGNDVYGSLGAIRNVPSPDGRTLTFPIEVFPDYPYMQDELKKLSNVSLPVKMYVINRNGRSLQTLDFTLTQ